MYHQTNPTETFRERELALMKEAENRRVLGRRLHAGSEPKARSTVAVPTIGLLAALLALFAFSHAAVGQQSNSEKSVP